MRTSLDESIEAQRHNLLFAPHYSRTAPSRERWIARRHRSGEFLTLEATAMASWARWAFVVMLAPGFLGMGFVAAFGSGTGLGMRTLLLVMFVAGALLIALILWPTDLRVSLARPNADRFVAVFRVPQGPFRRPIWVSEPVGASECALVIEPPNEQELQEAARHEDVRLDAPKPEEHWATLMLGERRILIACGLPAKLRRHGAVEKLAAFGVPVREVTVRRPMPEL